MVLDFFVDDDGKLENVSFDENKTIKDFILYYLKKYTKFVSLSTDDYTFLKGTKILNDDRYLGRKIGELIQPGSYITCVRKHELHYTINNI